MKKLGLVGAVLVFLAFALESFIMTAISVLPYVVLGSLTVTIVLAMIQSRGKLINAYIVKDVFRFLGGVAKKVLFGKRFIKYPTIAFIGLVGILYFELIISALAITLIGSLIILGASYVGWNLYAKFMLKKNGEILQSYKMIIRGILAN